MIMIDRLQSFALSLPFTFLTVNTMI